VASRVPDERLAAAREAIDDAARSASEMNARLHDAFAMQDRDSRIQLFGLAYKSAREVHAALTRAAPILKQLGLKS
jgi:hypothetical protein